MQRLNHRRPGFTILLACGLMLSIDSIAGGATLNEPTQRPAANKVRNELALLVRGEDRAERALAGLAVAVIDSGEVVFEDTLGDAVMDNAGTNSRPLSRDSLIRVASISKTLSAIVVMQLVDDGLLDLDQDVSTYLGWTLRNPNYPDRAISLRQLLSHTSSIRDAGESYIIRYPRSLREAFDPESRDYPGRFQPGGEQDRGPGVFYEYCNLNFGVIGSILERVTNTRFDLLMLQRFYQPLGLAGGFNVAAFSNEEQSRLAALYRKRARDGAWNPQGPWVSQVDDLSEGIPTALPEDAVYTPGTNGAQFSPQGGARLSLEGLEALAMLLLGDGTVGDTRLLSPVRMQDLRVPSWQFDSNRPNMDGYAGRLHARTAGLRIISGLTAEDSLFEGDARRWYGHFGEAYGLLAGVWVEPESGQGVIYAITGTAFDPYGEPGSDTGALLPIESRVVNTLAPLLTR